MNSGYDVVLEMKKSNQKLFKNLTFVQETQFFDKNEQLSKNETWYEAYSAPGFLMVKYNSMSSGDGIIFERGYMHVFENSNRKERIPKNNDLSILSWDVYHQPAKLTTQQLLELKYDMTKVKDTIWEGKEVYIIGNQKFNHNFKNIIIDKKRLYVLATRNKQKDTLKETLFKSYKKINGHFIATQRDFYENKKLVKRELYKNIKFPDTIDRTIYQAERFNGARW